METHPRIWRKLNGDPIGLDLYSAVEETLKIEDRNNLKVCIGSDSQVYGKIIEFATAVVFVRKGRGGFIYMSRYKSDEPMSLRQRMIREVSDSVTTAYLLSPLLDKYHLDFEVHADINTDPGYKSHVAYKEAMGYILGMGYVFKAKPYAFAGSCCANKAIK